MQERRGLAVLDVRRPLVVMVVMAVAVSVLLIGLPSTAVAAHHNAPRPKLRSATTSASRLTDAGGAVTVGASTVATRRCHLHVRPKLRRTPPVKTCTGRSVKWSVHLPQNLETAAARYHFTLTAVGAHHRVATPRHSSVTVAATDAPPTITSFAASKPELEFVGGQSHLVLTAAANLRCAVTVTPAVPDPPPAAACTRPTTRWPLTFPANATTSPITYTISIIVTGRHHQTATADTTVVVGAHPPPCPGQTSTAKPTTTAFFNDPTTHVTADQNRVVDAEINLICDAQLPVKGVSTRIAMGMYIYQLDRVSQALLWAQQYMHASVHVLLDGSNSSVYASDGTIVSNPAYESLLAGLPAGSVVLCGPNAGTARPPSDGGADDGGDVFPTGTACAGDNIMHTKLLITSAVDAAGDPAVFTSSQNLGAKAENAAMNNGLQIVGSVPLYLKELRYLTEIAADKPQADAGGALDGSPFTLPGATASTTFYPRNDPAAFPNNAKYHASNDQATDSVAKLLNTVDCDNPGASAGTHTGGAAHTSIRIAVSSYKKRPLVTAALQDLAAKGCDVQVVYSTIADKTLGALQASNIPAMQLNDLAFPYPDGSGSGLIFVHNKYLLISGGLRDAGTTKSNQDVVLTGSANLTQRSLHRNDEATIRYQQSANAGPTPIFDGYAANWDHMAAIAAAIPPPSG